MSERKRFRSVCFTLNNYTQEEIQHIRLSSDGGNFKYIVFQQERGAAGTPHLQGYAQRAQPTEFNTWKRLLGARCHLEQSRGTPAQNREYCTKDIDRIPGTVIYEKGEIPVQGERNDLTAIFEAAKDQSISVRDLVDTNGAAFIRYHKGILSVRSIFSEHRTVKTKVFWFYGSTGLGKSFECARLAPNAFYKDMSSHWWCGYDPNEHDDVVFEDYRCDFAKFHVMLRLLDFTKLSVQTKGGNVNFRAKRIFISTPRSPLETWAGRVEEELQQLLRRIEVVVEFTPSPFTDNGRVIANKVFHKGSPADLVVNDVGAGDQPLGVAEPPAEEVVVEDAPGRRTRRRVIADDDAAEAFAADEPPAPSQQFIARRLRQEAYFDNFLNELAELSDDDFNF
nr:MAG: replication polyprotein [Chemarfal virus 48]